MEIKTVLIEKRNNAGLLGYGAPRLHQFLSAFCPESTLVSFSMSPWPNTARRSCPNSSHNRLALAFPILSPLNAGCLTEEVDHEPAAGRDQDCLLDMDLVAVFWVPTAHTLQQPRLADDGNTKNAVPARHKAHILARNIVSGENGPAGAAG